LSSATLDILDRRGYIEAMTKTTPTPQIHIRLAEEMKLQGLSVPQAAEATNVPEVTIYRILRQQPIGIQFDTLARLCEGLGLEPGDLIVRLPQSG
jgi:DNA-binding Xre family transcriptional regulator